MQSIALGKPPISMTCYATIPRRSILQRAVRPLLNSSVTTQTSCETSINNEKEMQKTLKVQATYSSPPSTFLKL